MAYKNTLACHELNCDSSVELVYVTGPAKIGHVGTNYIPLQNTSYLRTGIEYFHSAICIVKPTKC